MNNNNNLLKFVFFWSQLKKKKRKIQQKPPSFPDTNETSITVIQQVPTQAALTWQPTQQPAFQLDWQFWEEPWPEFSSKQPCCSLYFQGHSHSYNRYRNLNLYLFLLMLLSNRRLGLHHQMFPSLANQAEVIHRVPIHKPQLSLHPARYLWQFFLRLSVLGRFRQCVSYFRSWLRPSKDPVATSTVEKSENCSNIINNEKEIIDRYDAIHTLWYLF